MEMNRLLLLMYYYTTLLLLINTIQSGNDSFIRRMYIICQNPVNHPQGYHQLPPNPLHFLFCIVFI